MPSVEMTTGLCISMADPPGVNAVYKLVQRMVAEDRLE
jgi:hypothetical protein